MDNPAGLINAAFEGLIKKRYKLPAFSPLDRLVRRVCDLVNNHLWNSMWKRMTAAEIAQLDSLFIRQKTAPGS